MLQAFNNLYSQLFGSKRLSALDRLCLEAWRASLDEAQQPVLDSQLAALRLVQTQAAGAKVCFYYRDAEAIPHFANTRPDVHAATVWIKSASSSERMAAKIYVHRGLFFSIEYPKRPDRYMQLHAMDPASLAVDRVEKKDFEKSSQAGGASPAP